MARYLLSTGATAEQSIMRRHFLLFLATSVLFIAAATANDDIDSLRTSLREANAARDGKQLVHIAQRLRARFPGHPTYSYLQARGHALQSEPLAALELLGELAARNVDMLAAAERDAVFTDVITQPAYRKLHQDTQWLRHPVGSARRQWQAGDGDTLPEAVAIAPDGRAFISSVRQREIIVMNNDGSTERWSAPSLWSAQGLHFSPDGKQLWVATSAMNVTAGIPAEAQGRTALAAFDAGTGTLLAHHELELPGEHVLGDFLFLDAGTLLATDSVGGGVYALDTRTGKFTQRIAPGVLRSPQGLAHVGEHVFIADYSNGLYRFDPANDSLVKVEDGPASPYGIDGLYERDGNLIAVQNGIRPQQVARFTLSPDGTRIVCHETLLANHSDFDEPTLGTIVGSTFYVVANSHWNHVAADGGFVPDELAQPLILSITLPRITDNENRAPNSCRGHQSRSVAVLQ